MEIGSSEPYQVLSSILVNNPGLSYHDITPTPKEMEPIVIQNKDLFTSYSSHPKQEVTLLTQAPTEVAMEEQALQESPFPYYHWFLSLNHQSLTVSNSLFLYLGMLFTGYYHLSIPEVLLCSLGANLAVLLSNIVLRLFDTKAFYHSLQRDRPMLYSVGQSIFNLLLLSILIYMIGNHLILGMLSLAKVPQIAAASSAAVVVASIGVCLTLFSFALLIQRFSILQSLSVVYNAVIWFTVLMTVVWILSQKGFAAIMEASNAIQQIPVDQVNWVEKYVICTLSIFILIQNHTWSNGFAQDTFTPLPMMKMLFYTLDHLFIALSSIAFVLLGSALVSVVFAMFGGYVWSHMFKPTSIPLRNWNQWASIYYTVNGFSLFAVAYYCYARDLQRDWMAHFHSTKAKSIVVLAITSTVGMLGIGFVFYEWISRNASTMRLFLLASVALATWNSSLFSIAFSNSISKRYLGKSPQLFRGHVLHGLNMLLLAVFFLFQVFTMPQTNVIEFQLATIAYFLLPIWIPIHTIILNTTMQILKNK